MKKRTGSILALCATLLCTAAFAAPAQLIMGTGGTTGTYYPLGGAISQIVTDNSNGVVSITAQATGASNENVNLIAAGDVDLAIIQNDIGDYAKQGTLFFKTPVENMVSIARLWPEHIQVAVRADSPAENIADFKGLNISVGAPGSGNEANVRQIFDVYGLDYKAFHPHFLSYAEAVSHFKDRLIDGFQFTTAAPNSGIQEIVTSQPLKFINIDGAKRDEIIAKYPFFAADVIPAGTYKGQDKDVETVAVQACLVARRDLPEDVAYAITKAIFENLEAIGQAHHKGKSITLKQALDGMTLDIHPGALKYYKEVGLVK